MNQIKVGFLLSYDYEYLKVSIPYVYARADAIALCMDAQGLTWAGNRFDIPDAFFAWIRRLDVAGKIRIYRDAFHVPGLTPLEADTRQRNMLGCFMGAGGWHVQLDADEYFPAFGAFCDFLHALDVQGRGRRPVTVFARWLPLYKRVDGGFLFVDTEAEEFPVATNRPHYTLCRETRQPKLRTTFRVVHQSWARPEAEMAWKIKNWGHKNDFDADAYLASWQSLDRSNYRARRDFHPMTPATWPRLGFTEAADIDTFMAQATVAAMTTGGGEIPTPPRGPLARAATAVRRIWR